MVSVVLATYNGSRFIKKQLESISNQTFIPDEVLIIDDCSSDDTVTLINRYITEKSLINWNIICNARNKGFYETFLDGICRSTGDTIYLADQDDIWDSNKIAVFEKIFKGCLEIKLLESNYVFIDDKDKTLKKQENYHGKRACNKKMCELTIYDMCKYAGSGFTMAFRKEVADYIKKNRADFSNKIFEYHDIAVGLISVSLGKVYLIKEVVDKHRIHESNATKSVDKSPLKKRTKEKQVDILKRRIQYFTYFSKNCDDYFKQKVLYEYAIFSKDRMQYISNFNTKLLYKLYLKKNMYATKFGIISDSLYSLGMEKLLNQVLNCLDI